MIKKTQNIKHENIIKCKDCMNSFDPDYSNLSFANHEPIMCSCRFSKYKVLLNYVDKKCQNSKPKLKKI